MHKLDLHVTKREEKNERGGVEKSLACSTVFYTCGHLGPVPLFL